jgi:hypothetical protein
MVIGSITTQGFQHVLNFISVEFTTVIGIEFFEQVANIATINVFQVVYCRELI